MGERYLEIDPGDPEKGVVNKAKSSMERFLSVLQRSLLKSSYYVKQSMIIHG